MIDMERRTKTDQMNQNGIPTDWVLTNKKNNFHLNMD